MRVYIRKPSVTDLREFIDKNRMSQELHRPWVIPPSTPQGFLALMDRLMDDRYEGFFICRYEDDAIVGMANLSEIIRGPMQAAFVGYWIYDGYQGNGYMTEGLALVIDEAFNRLRLHRLEINIQPSNTRSISLAKRLGLRKEGFSPKYLNIGGEWKDHERWAVVKDEWIERGGSRGVLGDEAKSVAEQS